MAGAAAAAFLCGSWLLHEGATTSSPPQPDRAAAADAAGTLAPSAPSAPGSPAASASHTTTGPALPPSPPVRLRIPAIRVDARVTGLGLDSHGELTTPPTGQHDLTGWYREGTAPGAFGTAVIIGHVDDQKGPSVFYLLGKLHPGQTLTVTRQDNRTAVFTVDAVRTFPKAGFPSHSVYDATGRAELRLVTCGGHYDHRNGYQANTVVFAHLTGSK
ncbi:class F sortase [Streptomyces tateyamensis]|uniref:Class F sortase n=2 Tax=Streptomyces tateyamensis TaxID=565073 RepID=A0A2V4NNN3_9ACTN|nr:class F sortase [Streptomyces tateyamensis]